MTVVTAVLCESPAQPLAPAIEYPWMPPFTGAPIIRAVDIVASVRCLVAFSEAASSRKHLTFNLMTRIFHFTTFYRALSLLSKLFIAWYFYLTFSHKHRRLKFRKHWFDTPTAMNAPPIVLPRHEIAPLTMFVGLGAMNWFKLGRFMFFTASMKLGPTFGAAISTTCWFWAALIKNDYRRYDRTFVKLLRPSQYALGFWMKSITMIKFCFFLQSSIHFSIAPSTVTHQPK